MNQYNMLLNSHPLYSSVIELWRLRDSIHRVSNLSQVESILSSTSKCYENPSLFCDNPIYDESSSCLLYTMAVLGHQILVVANGFFDFDRSMHSMISSSLDHIRDGLPLPCHQLMMTCFTPKSDVKLSDLYPVPRLVTPSVTSSVTSSSVPFILQDFEDSVKPKEPVVVLDPFPSRIQEVSPTSPQESLVSLESIFEDMVDSDSDFEKSWSNKKKKNLKKRVKVSYQDQGRAPRPNHSKEAKQFLRNWLENHKSHPYPTEKEKVVLCKETGLNLTQLNNWFINARRRYI